MAGVSVRVGDLTARDIGAGIKVVLPDDNAFDGYHDRVTGILRDYEAEYEYYTEKRHISLSVVTYRGIDVTIEWLDEDFLVTIYGQ